MDKKPTILISCCFCLLLPALPLRAKPEEVDKAERDAADNAAHDRRSGNTNLSYCGTLSQTVEEKYKNGKQYYQTFRQQLLEQVAQERRQLIAEDALSDRLESKIDKNSGQQFTGSGQQQAKDINTAQEKLKQEIENLKKNTLPRLQRENDNYTPGPNEPDELPAFTDAKRKLRQMEHRYKYMGRPLEVRRGNILSSESSLKASDRDNEAGAFAQSGCTYNQDTGDCALTGPLYEQNQRLRSLAEKGIREAEAFAKIQSEQLQLTEIKNAHNSDYKLFEALLSDKHTPEARQTLESHLNLAARTAAAAKYLSCRPIAEHDSKSYHLYRAASAVFLTALINDTSYYQDSASCRATEEFTDDAHNKQINTLEKVANLHENLFANLCLRTEPAEKELQEKCRHHVQKIFGSHPQYLSMPLTRDNALMMFKAAHQASLSELKNKWLLIKTANKQIKKGEKRVEEYQRKLAISIALKIAAKALKINFDAQANACAARTPTCSQFAYLKSQALKWLKKFNDYYVLEIYYGVQILRWKMFVNKWKKKLSKAKRHTHLACNQKEAEQETSLIKNLAVQSKRQLANKIIKEKNKILDDIHNTLKKPKTSFIPLLELLLAPIHAATNDKISTSKSMGIGYGTWAFQQFVQKRNRHWFLLAQDLNPQLTWPADNELYPLAYLDEKSAPNYSREPLEKLLNPLLKSLTGKKDYTNSPVESLGFSLPETRVLTTAQTIEVIEGNLQHTKNTLKTAAKQLDTYITLLKKAKERLPLGQKGLVESPSAPTSINKKVHCAHGKGKNLEFDNTCNCQKTNSCTQFNFPRFGKFTGPSNEYRLVEKIGNDTLKGRLKNANIKGSLLKKKNAIYNTRLTQKSSSHPITSSSQQKDDTASTKRNGKKNTSLKNTLATSLLYHNHREYSSAPPLNKRSPSSPSLIKRPQQYKKEVSASTTGKKQNKFQNSLPPISYFQNDPDPNRFLSSKKISNKKTTHDQYSEQESYQNRQGKRENATSSNWHGRMSDIFKVISRRYRKSAYPIFQKK